MKKSNTQFYGVLTNFRKTKIFKCDIKVFYEKM